MLDPSDNMFAAQLERFIRSVLHGDVNKPGLYQSIMASQTWDDFNRIRANIVAYEVVLKEMREIAKRITGDEEPRRSAADEQARMN